MENPVFYQTQSGKSEITPRQKQMLLKKITQLKHDVEVLSRDAGKLTRHFYQLGISAPDFSSYSLVRWNDLLDMLERTLQ